MVLRGPFQLDDPTGMDWVVSDRTGISLYLWPLDTMVAL